MQMKQVNKDEFDSFLANYKGDITPHRWNETILLLRLQQTNGVSHWFARKNQRQHHSSFRRTFLGCSKRILHH